MLSYQTPAGILSVTVVEACDLHDKDLFKNDPYVEVYFDEKYKQRTEKVASNNCPVWNTTFTFNISKGSSDHKLHVKVLDKDLVGSDKIGSGKLDVIDAYNGQTIDTWIKLPAKLGLTSHGQVHLIVQFHPE